METTLRITWIDKTKKCWFFLSFVAAMFLLPLVNADLQAQNCTVNAGIPQTICVNELMQLHGNSDGLFQGSGNIHWEQNSGPSVTIVDPTDPNTFVTGYVSGETYEFYYYAKCADGTLVFDPVTVTVLPITTANAGPDLISCPGSNILTLAGNTPGSGETGLWQVVGTNHGVSFSDATLYNTTISLDPNACGVTTLRWTITGPNSCHDFDDMTVTNRGGVIAVSAGGPYTVGGCYSATTSTTLNASFGGCGISGQTGHWTFISGPSTPVFGNVNSNTSSISNLVEGTYTVQWSVSGPCANGTATTTITVAHALGGVTGASAGGNQVFCDTRTSFVLTGNNPLYANETVTWVQISGGPDVTIANPHNPITNVTVTSPAGTYTFRYTILNTVTGCSSSASTSVTFNVNPTISLTADPFLPCDDSIATIDYSFTGNGSIQWSIISGPTNNTYPVIPTGWFDATTSPQLIYHLGKLGTYVIEFRVVPGVGNVCQTVTDEVSVTTSISPENSNSGTAQVLGCNVTSTKLAGNKLLKPGIGTWTLFGAAPNVPVFSDIHDANSGFSGLIAGRYRLRWLISGGPNCDPHQSDTRVIVASGTPTQAEAGPDATICYNFPYQLSGNDPSLNETGKWTVSANPPTSVPLPLFHPDNTDPAAVLSGLLANTVYTFTWTISNACSSTTAHSFITTTNTLAPVQANAGPDQCQPHGTPYVILQGNDPTPYNGLWTQLTGPTTAVFSDPTAYYVQVTNLIDGTYTFQWSNSYEGCGSTMDTVMVTISSIIPHANAGADQTICGTSTVFNGNPPATGEKGRWVQIAGPGGVMIADTTLYNSAVTGLSEGEFQFTWIISNGACGSAKDTVIFHVSLPASTAYAGPDQTICGTQPLSAHMAATGTPGLWSILSGPNTPDFSSVSDPHATVGAVTHLISGTYVFQWTTAGGPFCPGHEDMVNIYVGETANAGPDQSLCNATTTNLTGNSGTIGVWTQSAGPNTATITTTSPNSATASNLITGTYTFTYTISGAGFCLGSSANTHVTISGQPSTANAGPDQSLCNQSTITLAATPPATGTGTWSVIYPTGAGGSFAPNTHAPNAVYSVALSDQLYIFRWTVTDGGCSNADEVRIENYGVTTPCSAGPDQTICGSVTNMAATLAAHGIGTWTQVSGPAATIVSPNLNTTQITGLALNQSSAFRWTVTNGACASCSSDVTINTNTAPTIANAGPDQTLCEAAPSTILAGNTITVGTGTWTQISAPPGGDATITTPHAPNTTVTGLIHGVYTFRWTSVLGTCSSFDEMQITDFPSPTTASAGSDATICLFQTVQLNGNTPGSGTGLWTQLSGPTTAVITHPTWPVTTVTNVIVGTFPSPYTFRWTITVNPLCPASGDNVQITIAPIPSIAIAGPNQILCNDETSAIMAATTVSLPSTGTWTLVSQPIGGGATINTPTDPHTTVTGMSVHGTYTFKWTVSTGDPACDRSDNMNITKYADVVVAGPDDATICTGGSATLSVSATGGSGSYTYQWYSSTSGSPYNWQLIGGATNANYTTPALTSDRWYRCIVECGSVVTRAAHVTVNPDPTISVQPVGGVSCLGVPTVLSVSVSGGTGTFSYQWQRSAGTCTSPFWVTISGATASTYSAIPGLTTSYHVLVNQSGNGCGSLTSECITIIVPRILTNPVGTVICDGGTHTMSVTADNGISTLSYQWQESTTGLSGSFTNISGATNTTYTTIQLTTGNHYYRCVITVTSPDCADMISNVALVQVLADPIFTVVSNDVSMCQGGIADLSVTVSGGVGTFSYQWQQSTGNCSGIWSDITGATNSSYSTIQLDNPGNYYYQSIVSQTGVGCGPITSRCILVAVAHDPGILIQPVGNTICSGTTHTMSVVIVGGAGITTYQWEKSVGTCASPSWQSISGATTSSYTTLALTQTTSYHVLIYQSAAACNPLISQCVTVHIPHISVQPVPSTDICTGGNATLSVTVTSDGGTATYAYQWQESSSSSGPWSNVTGATSSTYTTDFLTTTTYYRCVISVSNPTCADLVTNTSAVVIHEDPTIDTNPTPGTICENDTWTMTVTAHGGTPVLIYQWQSSTDGSTNWTNVGTNNPSYTTAHLTADTWYRVIVSATGNGCDATTSTITKVTVNNLDAGVIATAQTICEGDIPVAFTSTTPATGDGVITYQWQSSTNLPTYTNISGATDATYSEPSALFQDKWYHRVATSTLAVSGNPDKACSLISAPIKVTVNNLTAGTLTAMTVCENTTFTILGSLPTADGTISYQWQISTDNSTYNNIPGATSQNYTTGPLAADTWYQRITTSTLTVAPQPAKACSKTSPPILVTVNNFLSDNTIGTAVTICENGTAALTGNIVTADGTVTYQWQSSTDNSTYNNISGATNQNYTTVPLLVDTWFRRIATSTLTVLGNGPKACTSTSTPVKVTVNNLTPGSIALSQTICENGTAALTGTLPTADGVITYQWQSSTDNITYVNVPTGGTSQNYTTDPLTADTWYKRIVTSTLSVIGNPDLACSKTSAPIKVTVNNVTPGSIAGDQTICNGGTPHAFTSVDPATGDGTITYQWQNSTDGSSFTNIPGATNATYAPGSLTADTWYRRVATSIINGNPVTCQANSNVIKVTVVPNPHISAEPVDITICSGNTTTLSVTATGGTGVFSYQWQSATGACPGTNWSNINGATDQTYTTPALTQTTVYRVLITQSGSACDALTSRCVTVSVPRILTQSGDATICAGGTYTAFVTVDQGSSTLAYQWWVSSLDCDYGYFSIPGATNSTYTTNPLPVGIRYYQCIISVTSPSCAALKTTCATVTVLADPTISVQPAGGTICKNSTYAMSVTASGGTGTFSYQWQSSTTGCSGFADINGATNSTYTTVSLTQTTYYQVIVYQSGAGCGTSTSTCATVIVVTPATAYAGGDFTICAGHSKTLSAAVATNYTTILWTTSGDGYFNNITLQNPTYTPGAADIALGHVDLTMTAYSTPPCTSATSAMRLTILPALSITVEPIGTTICSGGTHTMTVSATGGSGGLSYQWQSNTTGCAATFTSISGATSSSYLTPVLTTTTYYQVVISQNGSTCSPVTSACATVTVVSGPVISACCQPRGATICTGQTHTMNVALVGGVGNFSYQWQSNTTGCGSGFTSINGATNSTYTTPPLTQTTYYQVVVSQSGVGCGPVTSNCATVIVNAMPIANAGPDATISSGQTYTLNGTASNYSSVSWSTSGDGYFNNASSLTPVYTPGSLDKSSGSVNLTLTANGITPCGPVSDVMTLTILPALTITTEPLSGTICSGGTYTMSVVATGGTGVFSYQWQSNTTDCNSSFTNIPGATNSSYTTTVLSQTTYYKVLISQIGSGNSSILSNCATVTVTQPPTANAGSNGTTCQETAYTLSGTSATNYSSLLWSATPSGDGTFTGGTTLTPTFTPATGITGNVTLTLTAYGNSPCPAATSSMTLSIIAKPTANAGPDGTICQGHPYTVSGASESNASSYLWTSTGLGTLTNATNNLTPIYTPALGEIGFVTLTLTVTGNAPCGTVSDQMVIDFVQSATITTQPSGTTICSGSTYTMTVIAGGGPSTLSYQWQSNTTGCSSGFTSISGATNSSYTTPALTHTTYYQVIVTQTGFSCNALISNCATITVVTTATANAGGDATICTGNTKTLSAATATNYTSILWTTSGDGYFNNNSVEKPIYTPGSSDIALGHVVLTMTANSAAPCLPATSSMTLTIQPALMITTEPRSGTICSGGTYTMSVIATGGTGGFSYQWQSNTTDCNSSFTNIPGATNSSYTATALSQTTYYKVLISQNGSGCSSILSYCATVTVTQPPTANAGSDGSTCQETAYTLSGTSATNYSSLLWSVTPPGDGTFTGGTTLTPTFTPGTGITGNVTLTLTAYGNSPCPDATSSMTLNIKARPTAYAGPDGTICQGHPYTVSGASESNSSSYVWTSTGLGTLSNIYTLMPTYTPAPGEIGFVTLTLTVTGNAPCGTVSDQMVIDFTQSATITTQPSGTTICSGSTYTMTVIAGGGPSTLSYQWQSNTTSCIALFTSISGATNSSYTTPALTHTTYYQVIVTQTGFSCNALISNCATVMVVAQAVANAGADATICEGSTYPLAATASNYTSLLWSTSGDGYFNNASTLNPIYVPGVNDISTGVVTLTLTAYGNPPCANALSSLTLHISRAPIAYAGPDAQICENSTFCLCGATAYYYTNLWWTQIGGTGTLNNYYILHPVYTPGPLDNGCVKFVLHLTGIPPCGDVTDTMVLCIRRIPIVDAGPDVTICSQGSYTILLSSAKYQTGLLWTTSGNGTFDNATILHPTYTPGTTDLSDGHVTLTLLGLACSPCPNDSDKMVLTFSYPPIIIASVVTNVSCYGLSDGEVTVSVTGGRTPYSYLWSDPSNQTTQMATGLAAGTYTVTVTDYYSCTASSSATVTQPDLLTAVTTITHVNCYTYSDGAVSLTVTGGTTPYTYIWSNGSTTRNISGLTADTYTVTVTDSHGCTTISTNTITQPPAWGPQICGSDLVCQGTTVQYCVCEPRRPGSTYQWTVSCGTILDGCCSSCVTVRWDHCSQGTICVTETRHDDPLYDGCIITRCKTITLKPVPSPSITGPMIVMAGQAGTVYCTPNYPGHLYSWSVIDGTVTNGQGTNCITVTWNSSCNNCIGQVIAYETEDGCCGTDTMYVTILPGTGNLDGYVTYKNPYNTGLNGVLVILTNSLGIIIGTTYTGPNMANSDQPGYYTFENIPNGTYHITANSTGIWGGNNATDALIIELYAVHLYSLSGLNLKAADVNADLAVNATDALWVKLRTVGMMNSYPAGDWTFTDTTFTLTTTASINLKGLCVGDVNGSYIPTGFKESSFLSVIDDGIMTIPVNKDFNYTIRSNSNSDLGAMTLFMGYDPDRFEVGDVTTSLEGMKYVIRDGQLKLAWSNKRPLTVKENDPILTLRMKAKSAVTIPAQIFDVKPGSEFADPGAVRYDNFELKMSGVVTPDNPMGFSIFNFPNPFQNTTDVVYTIPEQGHVKLVLTNLLGEELRTLVDADQSAGSYTIRVNPVDDNLKPGVYLYKIKVDGVTTTYVKTNKMIFTR